MKGRKIGTIEISMSDMETIAKMTGENATRREIADKINRCSDTVWRYQKKLDLL
jgi:predicted DNA-binding protein YlxM (UPF0122 family)